MAHLTGFEGVASLEQCWAGLARILGHWASRGFRLFAVEERGSDALVGMVGVIEPLAWPGSELIWIFARPHWNRGIATEVAVGDWAVDTLPERDLVNMIPPTNAALGRVAEKIGSCRRGEVRHFGEVVELYGYERQRATVEVASV